MSQRTTSWASTTGYCSYTATRYLASKALHIRFNVSSWTFNMPPRLGNDNERGGTSNAKQESLPKGWQPWGP